jgi:hypothetical protein
MRRGIKHKKRGIVLMAVCLCLLLLMAGLGLGIDLNRLLITQQGLRANAEAEALAAVLELDGTPAGLERARIRAADTWRRQAPPANSSFVIEFGPTSDGPWNGNLPASADLRAARVTASSTMQLTLLRNVVREKSLPVDAAVRAGQRLVDTVESGLLPFAVQPDGRFRDGLTVAAHPTTVRGAILNGVTVPVKVGDKLPRYPGVPAPERETLLEIIRSDSDPVSATYAEYSANRTGQRPEAGFAADRGLGTSRNRVCGIPSSPR